MELSEEQARNIADRLGESYVAVDSLGSGAHNVNFLLSTEREKYVVRIAPQERIKPISEEFSFLKLLDGAFGPEAVLLDDSGDVLPETYMVLRFIEGSHPETFDEVFLSALAAFYKRLHERERCEPNDAFYEGRYRLTRRWEQWVSDRYEKHKRFLPDAWASRIDELFVSAQEIIDSHEALLTSRECFSVVHLDPNPKNILLTKDGIRLLDWEFATWDAPEWDLVAVWWALELSDDQFSQFLDAYGFPVEERKTLSVFQIIHICMLLSWRTERVFLVQEGNLPERVTHRDEQQLVDDFSWMVPQVEELVGRLR